MSRVLRLWATAAGAIAASMLFAPGASASGETFDVTFCSELNRAHGATFVTTNEFDARQRCSDASNDNSIKIENVSRALDGRLAKAYWEVPEHLAIVGVSVDARLRRSDGYRPLLYMADGEGRQTAIVAGGDRGASAFETVEWSGAPQERFVASLECVQKPSCDPSVTAKTWVRNVTFTVADYSDPVVEVGGSLFEPGWKRGEASVSIEGTDLGAGLDGLSVASDETLISAASPPCGGELGEGVALSFFPCSPGALLNADVDTSSHPLVSGRNYVSVCGQDFAGNVSCETSSVLVDNVPPSVAFASIPIEDDPELITASVADSHSGLSNGSISFRAVGTQDWQAIPTGTSGTGAAARVDSASVPPGQYEFRATASDVAGNVAETTLREDGTPMVLDFPLKSGVDLNARIEPGGSERTTLKYGKKARAEGRLLDASGAPMSDQLVTVEEYFGEGALIDRRTRTVQTDEEGRWVSKLPAGPSRTVSVLFAGDQRYLDDQADAGRLAVKTGARMGLTRSRVPEGRATRFKGRIGRLGARTPTRGKLLQLQFQDPASGRWSTVRNPFRSRSDGRFSFRYAFGTHYVTDVSIRFRLKVPSELGWPYRGTHTKGRRVIVKAG